MIKISVIIPVYNSRLYIEKCINSILLQDFTDFEIIIVDDGSNDGSSEICDSLSKKDKRIKVYHKKNGGICEARNYGLKYAKGEYIAFSDHDDLVRQGFLSSNYNLAKKYNADIVKFGRYTYWIENGKIISKNKRKFEFKILNKEDIKDKFLYLRFNNSFTCVWDGIFKREFLKENNLIFNTFYKKGGEDIEFCSNCFLKAKKVVFNNKIFYEHFIRLGYSTSTKFDEEKLKRNNLLTDNLLSCMKSLNIKKNEEIYLFNLIKENIYSSMCYLISNKFNYNVIEEHLNKIYSKYVEKDMKIKLSCNLLKVRLMAWLFIKKKYKILYILIKWYKKYKRG